MTPFEELFDAVRSIRSFSEMFLDSYRDGPFPTGKELVTLFFELEYRLMLAQVHLHHYMKDVMHEEGRLLEYNDYMTLLSSRGKDDKKD